MNISIRVSHRDGETRYRCGRTPDAIEWHPVGCSHASPREASDHVNRLVERQREMESASAIPQEVER